MLIRNSTPERLRFKCGAVSLQTLKCFWPPSPTGRSAGTFDLPGGRRFISKESLERSGAIKCMGRTRHKSMAMLKRYVRHGSLFAVDPLRGVL